MVFELGDEVVAQWVTRAGVGGPATGAELGLGERPVAAQAVEGLALVAHVVVAQLVHGRRA